MGVVLSRLRHGQAERCNCGVNLGEGAEGRRRGLAPGPRADRTAISAASLIETLPAPRAISEPASEGGRAAVFPARGDSVPAAEIMADAARQTPSLLLIYRAAGVSQLPRGGGGRAGRHCASALACGRTPGPSGTLQHLSHPAQACQTLYHRVARDWLTACKTPCTNLKL